MTDTAAPEPLPPNLRRTEASSYLFNKFGLSIAPSTLAKWFSIRSHGPPAFVAGRVPLYPRAELDAWAVERLGKLRRSTSDEA